MLKTETPSFAAVVVAVAALKRYESVGGAVSTFLVLRKRDYLMEEWVWRKNSVWNWRRRNLDERKRRCFEERTSSENPTSRNDREECPRRRLVESGVNKRRRFKKGFPEFIQTLFVT